MKKLTEKQKETLINKIRLQLEGIDEANRIYEEILGTGYGNLNKLQISEYKKIIKGLKSFHVKEISSMFDELFKVIDKDGSKTSEYLVDIYAVLTKSREYLEKRLLDVENNEDREIEMLIQTNYTFNSLKKDGYVKEANITLLTITKDLKKLKGTNEIWLDLDTSDLYYTQGVLDTIKFKEGEESGYTPYINIKEMAIYPGENTPRITFKDYEIKKIDKEQIDMLLNMVQSDISTFEQEVKDYLKYPLNKYGYYLLQASVLHDAGDYYIIENEKGENIKVLKQKDFKEGKVEFKGKEKLKNGIVLLEVKKDSEVNIIINLKALINDYEFFKIN